MIVPRAHLHCPAGHWPEKIATDSLSLDFDARHRRRIQMMTDAGESIMLDLTKAIAMSDGDGLQLDDGRWLRVHAAAEQVVHVTHVDSTQLARIAWHLGNRHLPTQIGERELWIRPDHVIEQMLAGLGAQLTYTSGPFQPESGAYSSATRSLTLHAHAPHQHE